MADKTQASALVGKYVKGRRCPTPTITPAGVESRYVPRSRITEVIEHPDGRRYHLDSWWGNPCSFIVAVNDVELDPDQESPLSTRRTPKPARGRYGR